MTAVSFLRVLRKVFSLKDALVDAFRSPIGLATEFLNTLGSLMPEFELSGIAGAHGELCRWRQRSQTNSIIITGANGELCCWWQRSQTNVIIILIESHVSDGHNPCNFKAWKL